MKKRLLRFTAGALSLAASMSHAQPFGIDTRAENTTLLIDSLPADGAGTNSMQLTQVFDNLSLVAPVYLTESPDDSGRLFVIQQCGQIISFEKSDPAGTKTTYLDASSLLQSPCSSGGRGVGSEEGLLGLAFDPDFATTGELYIYYSHKRTSTADQRRSHISRFTASPPNAATVSVGTEELLLSVDQDFSNHNGGMIHFGPDGMLYIQLGDGGLGGDPNDRAQNTTNLLGNILRIDVNGTPDQGLAYRIPPDNPFFNGGPAGASTLKEIYAYGFRNPWRGHFDPLTDIFYVADVGQDAWEEVDVVVSGGNYGWDHREGAHCFEPSQGCQTEGLIDPIAEYSQTFGDSITGLAVYTGTEVPELYGNYLYADYGSGRVWRLLYDPDSQTVVDGPVQIAQYQNGKGIAGYGTDKTGEVFVLDTDGGEIYVLRPNSPNPGGDNPVPLRLSEVPALLAAGLGQDQTDNGVIPYEPSSKLWSDGTHKERYIALPHFDQATYMESGGWGFDEDAVVIKNFLLPLDERDPLNTLKRIETRILTKQDDSWYGFSYEWNEDETDAVLLTSSKTRPFSIIEEDGSPLEYEWSYPSRSQCLQCHTAAANRTLGITTGQLNFDFEYPESGVTDNQLRTLNHISILKSPGLPDSPENLPRIPDHGDESELLRERARAYLASNCSMCHQPGGGAPGGLDMRWETSDGNMNLIGVSAFSDLGVPGLQRIDPGDPANSAVILRMSTHDASVRMPPIGTSRVDEEAVQLISDWITDLQQTGVGDWMAFQ